MDASSGLDKAGGGGSGEKVNFEMYLEGRINKFENGWMR